METVGIIILCMALVVACIYIDILKSDNYLMRAQLSACRESMASERLIFKTGQKEYKARIEELRRSLAEARALKGSVPDEKLTITTNPIKVLKFSLKEFESETEGSKARGLMALKMTVGELVLKGAKHTRFRVPYTKADFVTEYEVFVADMSDESNTK